MHSHDLAREIRNFNFDYELNPGVEFAEFARQGKLENMQLLLKEYPDLNVNERHRGYSALHYAAMQGEYEISCFLLSLPTIEANLHSTGDDCGITPLICAIGSLNLSSISLFLHHPKININQRALNGQSPLSVTSQNLSLLRQVISWRRSFKVEEEDLEEARRSGAENYLWLRRLAEEEEGVVAEEARRVEREEVVSLFARLVETEQGGRKEGKEGGTSKTNI